MLLVLGVFRELGLALVGHLGFSLALAFTFAFGFNRAFALGCRFAFNRFFAFMRCGKDWFVLATMPPEHLNANPPKGTKNHHAFMVRREEFDRAMDVIKARGVEMPPSFWTDPLMYQGGSDSFIGCNDEIEMADEAWGIDFEGEIGVITDDVPMGISPAAARKHIKLVTILNDVSLRNVIVAELAKGFGFFHGKPATAFAPVAVTPDELLDRGILGYRKIARAY